ASHFAADFSRRPLRPVQRARRVRRGLRRAPRRGGDARDGPARAARPGEPRAPRGGGRGSQHGRRRRDPAADAARVLRRGGRGPAGPRGLRGLRLLPPARRGAAGRVRGLPRGRHARGGPGGHRLARRPGRHGPRRRDRRPLRAPHPPAVRRSRAAAGRRSGRLRAQALRHPPRRRDRRRSRPRHPELLLAAHRLQGDAHRAAGDGLLPRPAGRAGRECAGARALALLHQHLPVVGARPSVPADRPQRGDQHAARQRQLDARARVAAGLRAVRRRPRQGPADRAPGRIGLGDLRQRAGAADPGRAVAAARDHDDDPGGLRRPRRHPGSSARLLRLPRLPDGALGRARGGRVHRRPGDRRHARSQRPAAGALDGDQGRLGHPRLGDRRHRRAGLQRAAQGAAAARQALPGRPRAGPHRARRGGQARDRHPAALRRVVRRGRRPPRRPAAARAGLRPLPAHPPAPAGVRLHAGGPARPHHAAGRQRRGADRLDGQRLGARRPLGPPAAAVRLLQAALRPGHQPADRPDPRGRGHERRDRRGLGGQPARRVARARAPARDGPARAAQRRAREAAPGRLVDLPRPDDRRHLAGRRGPGGPRGRRRAHLRGGLRRARLGRQRPDPVRSRHLVRSRADPVAARRLGGPQPPRARWHPSADRPGGGVGRAARDPPLRHADRLRRLGDQPVPALRDPRRARRRRPRQGRRGPRRGARPHCQGDRQGPAQDAVEDGHLHGPVVLRRADLRGRRPGAGPGRGALHRHRVAHRRDRHGGPRRRDARAPPPGLSAQRDGPAAGRRRLRLAPRRRAPHVESRDHLAAAACGAPRGPRDLRRVRPPGQRRRDAPGHAARPHEVPLRRGRRHPDRGGGAGVGDRQALRHGRHVARLPVARGAREPGHRHEPHRRALELGRGRRGSGALHARRQRRLAALGDQAGRLGPLRGQHPLPGQRRRAADQDGPGRQAGGGRPASGPQGRLLHRPHPLHHAGRGADLAAAPSRHLLDRGPQAADLRPALRQPGRAHLGQAGRRGRRRDRGRGRRQGQRRPRPDRGPRRRHRSLAAVVGPLGRHPVGDRPRRDAADAGPQRPALADGGADRRAAQDGPRRGHRRPARGRRDGLRDRPADRDGLHHDARLPPEHLPGGHRDAGPGAAQALQRPAGARGQLLLLRRRGGSPDHGPARHPAFRRPGRPHRPARARHRHRPLEGARRRPLGHPASARRRAGHRAGPLLPAGLAARGAPRLEADRARPSGDRRAPPGDRRAADPQHRPRDRRHPLARGDRGARLRRPEVRDDPADLPRLGGTVVRRLARARHRAQPVRRRQRLRRQGALGRRARRAPARGRGLSGRDQRRRRQHGALRGHPRPRLLPRARGRALRGAQLGRQRRRRGRRRPRLRVHDRRAGRGAGPHGAQLRRRHERWHRLRPRSRRHLRAPLQHGSGRLRCDGRGRRGRAPHAGQRARPAHRLAGRRAPPGRLGRRAGALPEGHAPRLQARPAGARRGRRPRGGGPAHGATSGLDGRRRLRHRRDRGGERL
ncbi:MAG: Glutamate synthase [NADPH] large chain, partial [uncultured Solirubrobacteraceae bacterium]